MHLPQRATVKIRKGKTYVKPRVQCLAHARCFVFGSYPPLSLFNSTKLDGLHCLWNLTSNFNVQENGFRIPKITLFGNSILENTHTQHDWRQLIASFISLSTSPPCPWTRFYYQAETVQFQRFFWTVTN